MRTTLGTILFLAATNLAVACQSPPRSAQTAQDRTPADGVQAAPPLDPTGATAPAEDGRKDEGSSAPAREPAAPPSVAAPGTLAGAEGKIAKNAAKPVGGAAGTGHGYGIGSGGGRRGVMEVQPLPNTEGYRDYGVNAWIDTAKDHLSTFAVDVDTASYSIARRKLNEGTLPPKASVRVEELVNYFRYGYAAPTGHEPFSVTADLSPSPLAKGRHILRVGVATKAKSTAERKPANLVFLVDVSGSMQSPDKLPLAKQSLRILVGSLKDGDTVSLVTYAGSTRVVLPPTGLAHKPQILAAIDDLSAGGSTAMASGLQLAYDQASRGLTAGTVSRVVVLSDGDANVGRSSHGEILETIAGQVKEGVTLSTIGFGMGNYKDEMMEQLANKGNGNNFYIDSLSQAKRVFQQQLGSTLEVVAQDVKLQVDFDPTQVERYRLIGYENRDVADVDFRDDKVDAGEIGAGHQVTALYELELKHGATGSALGAVRVRHKAPRGEVARESTFPIARAAIAPTFASASSDHQFAFAVAAFADVLRGSEAAGPWNLAEVRQLAAAVAGNDSDRRELVALIDQAIRLSAKGGMARR